MQKGAPPRWLSSLATMATSQFAVREKRKIDPGRLNGTVSFA